MGQIVKVNPEEFGLQAKEAATIEKAFKPMLAKMTELEKQFNEVVKMAETEITPEAVSAARELRLQYVKTRTGTAAIHKEAKAYYLAGGRFVDGWKSAQLFASQGKEQALEKIEKHFELQEAERLEKIKVARYARLTEVGYTDTVAGIEMMDEKVFDAFVAGAEKQVKLIKEAEEAETAERVKKEAEDALLETRKKALFPFGNLLNPEFDFESLRTMSEVEFDRLLDELEATNAEAVRLQQEKEKEEKIKEARHKKRNEELRPYIIFIRDYPAMLDLLEEDYTNELNNLKRAAADHAEHERKKAADAAKAEEIIKQQEAEEKRKAEEREKAEQATAAMGENDFFLAMMVDIKAASTKYAHKFNSHKGKFLYNDIQTLIAKIDKFVNEKIK